MTETPPRGYVARRRIPGAPVGNFTADSLPTIPRYDSLIAAIEGYDGLDSRFIHAPETPARVVNTSLVRGTNLFGPIEGHGFPVFETGHYRMRAAETVLLHDALFSAQSMTVSTTAGGFFDASLANYFLASPRLDHMVSMDRIFELDAAGTPIYSAQADYLGASDSVALTVCGTGFPNYGHFLYDGLPLIHLLMATLHRNRPIIVGPALSDWQHAILAVLGLADDYRVITHPVVFRKLVTTSLISLHVPYPTRFVRPMLDTIRFRVGGPAQPRTRRVFVSRSDTPAKRDMINRDAVEARFSAAGFDIIHPQRLTFVEQVELFSACIVVAGESGAGMANIGFCDPGTKVLEIQPSLFVEGWTRAACMLFSHEWHVLFARSQPATNPDPAVPAHMLRFEVDLADLDAAIARVTT